jgi:hypothetical protein
MHSTARQKIGQWLSACPVFRPRSFAPLTPRRRFFHFSLIVDLFAGFFTTMTLSDSSLHSAGCSAPDLGTCSGFFAVWARPPGFRVRDIHTCFGSTTPGNPSAARAFSQQSVLPSRSPNAVGIPDLDFGALYRAYVFPCQRLVATFTSSNP